MVRPAPEFNKRMQVIREIVSEEVRLEMDALTKKIVDRIEMRLRKELEETGSEDVEQA